MSGVVKVRTVHHLSATGGTVICKAIAALPRVVLLSEMNPNGGKLFAPRDPFPQVATNYPGLFPGRTMESVFLERIVDVEQACTAQGLSLVVRDHSHTDFLNSKVRSPRVRPLLGQSYALQSIATVRNPVDSWLGMVASAFNVASLGFTAYCDRVKLFLDAYGDLPLFRYEDFTAEPQDEVARMAAALDLPFDPGFAQRIGAVRLSGDSGRLQLTREIQQLGRREMPPELPAEIQRPENRSLLERLGYDPDQ